LKLLKYTQNLQQNVLTIFFQMTVCTYRQQQEDRNLIRVNK